MIPSITAPIADVETAQKVLRLIDALEDLDDVQNVTTTPRSRTRSWNNSADGIWIEEAGRRQRRFAFMRVSLTKSPGLNRLGGGAREAVGILAHWINRQRDHGHDADFGNRPRLANYRLRGGA